MTTGATGQLGLALPVQGELSGTWGDTVNNGITQYTNIAIAATLTLTNDGAVTLANTTGDASASNITSTLTGAGTVTAQFAIVRVTGTLTTAKVVTAPSYSKTYTVVNAATGGIVTFKAAGQTGVSIAVGESAFVYFNGTDYVKVSSTVDTGVTSFTAGTTGFTPSTATTGAVTLAGTLATTNGGTGLTSFTSGGVVYASSSSALATGSALTFNGTSLGVGSSSYGDAGTITASIGLAGTTAGGLQLWAGSAQEHSIQWGDSTTGSATYAGAISYSHASDFMRFWTASTEQMRLTSTGLGIGTSVALLASTYLGKLSVYTAGGANFNIGGASNTTNTVMSRIVGVNQNNGNSGNESSNEFQGITSIETALVTSNSNVSGNSGGYLMFKTKADAGALTERMRILSTGAVTIGDTASYARFAVRGFTGTSGSYNLVAHFGDGVSGNSGYIVQGGSGSNTVGLLADSGSLILGSGLAEKARISNAGGFSVGTTADPGAGAIYATGNITAYYSDARLKTVSGKIENALDKVAQLSGVYYTNNSVAKSFGYDSDEVQVGVLAQDVEAVLPEIVKAAPFDLDEHGHSKSGENYKTVQYERLVPLLIEAINELQAKVKALEAK